MIPKFRAWDKKTETIQEIESISFKEKKLVIDQKSVTWFNSDYIRNFGEVDLMQSTGMKDKNGVDIFEWDIVLVNVSNGFDHLVNEKTVVQESEFHSGLIYKSLASGMEYRVFKHKKMDYEYEVIGNIYENSELLEEQR
ncbi:YopX family protein [Enterococcus faecium]|uniref:YopX family protein n=1 Tax=Enterococcus faecium TaxID=1352 RepID=UPI0028E1FAB5|nr:YopX family protein [Enterococcus faecium]MDT9552212.1 YopX family protein [Enterococcus faecium]